jgi:transcriptional regulator with XRE-family HTH domain
MAVKQSAEACQWRDGLIHQLREARRNAGLTQADVEDILGCTQHLVAKWEVDIRRPSFHSVYCWARALGYDLVLEKREDGSHAPDYHPVQSAAERKNGYTQV